MNSRFSVNFFSMIVDTAFLNVALSIYHKCECFTALIEADLGAEYRRANSPKPSPGRIVLLVSPLIYTVSFPSCKMKNELALSFCFIRYSPSFTLHIWNLSSKVSWSCLSSIRLESVKWDLRLLRISALSVEVFFLSTRAKFSYIWLSSLCILTGQNFLVFLFPYSWRSSFLLPYNRRSLSELRDL